MRPVWCNRAHSILRSWCRTASFRCSTVAVKKFARRVKGGGRTEEVPFHVSRFPSPPSPSPSLPLLHLPCEKLFAGNLRFHTPSLPLSCCEGCGSKESERDAGLSAESCRCRHSSATLTAAATMQAQAEGLLSTPKSEAAAKAGNVFFPRLPLPLFLSHQASLSRPCPLSSASDFPSPPPPSSLLPGGGLSRKLRYQRRAGWRSKRWGTCALQPGKGVRLFD